MSATTMIGRMTILPSTTTARSLIECMPGLSAGEEGSKGRKGGPRRTEDGALRDVDDRGAVERAKDAAVRAGEGGSSQPSFALKREGRESRADMVNDPPAMSSSVSLLSRACVSERGQCCTSATQAREIGRASCRERVS